jgi:PAS domain-containing protein
VAHVELSLSEPFTPHLDSDHDLGSPELFTSIDRWSAATRGAVEPCMVIDEFGAIAAVSPSACNLLGLTSPDDVIGEFLQSGDLLALVDFTPAPAALSDGDVEKIPPLLALSSGRLARGLMRVRSGAEVITLDAVATPLRERNHVNGSLTFFCLV